MGDADWWLCECQSLNNLSARRCYSCRRRKPKAPVRASEHLGYRIVVTWDGKIRLEDPPPPELVVLPVALRRPPPLREPVLRSITDVAPSAPQGTRITYWLGDPTQDPRRPVAPRPPMPSMPPLAPPMPPPGPPGWHPPASAPAWHPPAPPPHGEAPPTLPAVAVPVVAPPPPPLRPAVAVPIVGGAPPSPIVGGAPAGPVDAPPQPSWPHWRELLEGPRPDADRLRRTLESTSPRRRSLRVSADVPDWLSAVAPEPSPEPNGSNGSHAHAHAAAVREAVPWPAEDLAAHRAAHGADPSVD